MSSGFRVQCLQTRNAEHGGRNGPEHFFSNRSVRRITDLCLMALIVVIFRFAAVVAQEKIRIAPSSPGLSAWPVHLAVKEGFFASEGLDVEIIVMRTNVGIAALVTGSIDFTTAGGSAMRGAINGGPLKDGC